MSTPNLVPMISPDGSIGDVPAENVAAASSRGFKRGINVISKDGQKGTIPLENLGAALQNGILPEHAMQMRRPMNQSPSIGQQIGSGLQTLGNGIEGMIEGIGRTMADPVGTAANSAVNAGIGIASQPTTGSKIAAGIAPILGVDPLAVQQAAIHAGKTGDYGPLVASGVLPLATVRGASALGAGKIGPQVDGSGIVNELASGEIPAKAPITDEVAAQRITDAVNPAPRQMAKFQDNVQKQMPNIRQFITEKPKSPSDLLDVVSKAAETKRNDYYQNIIQPNADVNVGAPSLYKGEQAGNGSATISQLDNRLSQINNMLSGAYDKEGTSQIQALSAPEKMALKAESAQIRDVMNEELGTRTGLGKQAVAQARSDFGQLRDIQMKLQTAIARQRYAENQQGPAYKGAVGGAVAGALTGHPLAAAGGAVAGLAAELAGRAATKSALSRGIKGAF